MRRTLIALALSLLIGVADGFAFDSAQTPEPVPAVKVLDGAVVIDNPTSETVEVTVYAITGSVVRNERLDANSEERFELPSGYYIVKVGKLSKRVAVR